MKFNKNYILLSIILLIGSAAYFLIPSFEREEFNSEIVEDISSGNITTTTSQETEENENSQPEKQEEEFEEETFESSIYDEILVNNSTKRVTKKGTQLQLHIFCRQTFSQQKLIPAFEEIISHLPKHFFGI